MLLSLPIYCFELRESGERPLQKTAAVTLTRIYESGKLTGYPVFKGLKPLVSHEWDWEGEPESQGSQKTYRSMLDYFLVWKSRHKKRIIIYMPVS